MDYISRLFSPPTDRNVTYIIGASVITTFTILTVSRLAFQGKQRKIIRSPRETLLPTLTKAEIAELVYPPDVLPGGRDVDSPYGTIRVYEWGPEEGRKVLLVHGITTPCITLGAVAHGLVERGCRVMLFDLWGRGYSDGCADLEYDDRLYASEILIALTSSLLSWTGGPNGGFSLVGYSLGGGIAASFASYFPGMVRSLVLIAPSGLIRPKHMSSRNRFLYSMGLVPEAVVNWIVKRRLKAGPMYKNENDAKNEKATVGDVVTAEVEGNAAPTTTTSSISPPAPALGPAPPFPPLSLPHPSLTVEAAVRWQLDHHVGFTHAFMSSIRFSPLSGQHAAWRRLSLVPGAILIFAGSTDPIIVHDELREDVLEILGEEKVEWRQVQGAHDFPITESGVVVREIGAFWGL